MAGLLSLIILGIISGGLVFAYYASSAPELTEEGLNATSSSLVFDNKGELIADLGAEKRDSVTADNIPINLVNAVTSIEDHRFFKHRGIDVYRIMGSVWNNLTKKTLQGGSTLDQQLIKLSYFSTASSDRTIKRKIQEIWLSLQMEQQFTKDEILTFYVNKVFMGNGNYGMLTASKAYFGKELNDLSYAQVALLAGIPQAPSQYNPYTNPEAAQARRNIVLDQMLRHGHLTQEEHDQAVATPISDGLLPLVEKVSFPKYLDNYLTQVIEEVEKKTNSDIFTAGLKVYTNVDIATQQQLWDIYHTDYYVYYPDPEFQVASTVMDVSNGKVIAQLGARNPSEESSFGTNQAVLTDRDWGSTMKPITVYAPALENNVYSSTGQTINDSFYYWPGTTIEVNNWDRLHYGLLSMQSALQLSRNVPAVRVLEEVGLDKSLSFLNGLGINYPAMYYSNAISSNTSEVDQKYGASSEKMAAAYAAFANGGTYYEPQYVHRIEFSDGRVEDYESGSNRAMSESTAYMMTSMLKTVLWTPGTGTEAYIPGLSQAGKSGTSNYTDEELDSIAVETGLSPYTVGTMAPDELFVGYTPQYAMAVWTGYKNRMTPLYGDQLRIAQRVYKAMMTYLNPQGNTDWVIPNGVYQNGGYFQTGKYVPQQQIQWSIIDSSTEESTSETTSSSSSGTPTETIPGSETAVSSTYFSGTN